MTTIAVVMFWTAMFYIVYLSLQRFVRCSYCGKTSSHDEHCPYQIGDE